jgi:hypothetical protein
MPFPNKRRDRLNTLSEDERNVLQAALRESDAEDFATDEEIQAAYCRFLSQPRLPQVAKFFDRVGQDPPRHELLS